MSAPPPESSPPEKPPEKPPEQPPGPPKPPPPKQWTEPETRDFITALGTVGNQLGDRYIEFKKEEWRQDVAMQNAQSKADWRVLGLLMLFLAVVIVLMVWLVFVGKVSGDALLFLVGSVSGYIFALVQRHLFPEAVEIPQQ